MRPLAALAKAVEEYASSPLAAETRADAIGSESDQFGLSGYAYCNAVLATLGDHARRTVYTERAVRCLETCLARVNDIARVGAASRRDHANGLGPAVQFWPPEALKAFLLLWDMDVPEVMDWSSTISNLNTDELFLATATGAPPAWWLCGEWIRFREGLSPYTLEQLDDWLTELLRDQDRFDLEGKIAPGPSDADGIRDHFYLADILAERYNGRMKEELAKLMEVGLARSLAVRTGVEARGASESPMDHAWIAGAQCAYYTHAVTYFLKRKPEYALSALDGTRRAYASLLRLQIAEADISLRQQDSASDRPTVDSHWSKRLDNLRGASYLAAAIVNGFDDASLDAWAGREV